MDTRGRSVGSRRSNRSVAFLRDGHGFHGPAQRGQYERGGQSPSAACARRLRFVFALGADRPTNRFVWKLDPTGASQVYQFHIGTAIVFSASRGIAVDGGGNAYVVGYSNNSDIPTTAGAFQTTKPSARGSSGFVVKINPAGAGLVYGTYLGTQGNLTPNAIALDTAGAAYITERSDSFFMPNFAGAGAMFNLNSDQLFCFRPSRVHGIPGPAFALIIAVRSAGRDGGVVATVMIVEDDPVFLTRFCRIVASDPELELFATLPDCASARQALSKAGPDVLLTDLGLPDGSGIDLIRETSQRYPATDIMVVTVFGDEEHVLSAIEAGATGYILKDSIPEEFVALIKQLRTGGSRLHRRAGRAFRQRRRIAVPRQAGFSDRSAA